MTFQEALKIAKQTLPRLYEPMSNREAARKLRASRQPYVNAVYSFAEELEDSQREDLADILFLIPADGPLREELRKISRSLRPQ